MLHRKLQLHPVSQIGLEAAPLGRYTLPGTTIRCVHNAQVYRFTHPHSSETDTGSVEISRH